MHRPNVACPLVKPLVGPTGVEVMPAEPAVEPVPDPLPPDDPPIVPAVSFVAGCDELENCTVACEPGRELCDARSTPTAAAAVAKPITPTAEAAASLNGTSFFLTVSSFDLGGPAGAGTGAEAAAAAAAATIGASRLSSAGRAGPLAARTSLATPS